MSLKDFPELYRIYLVKVDMRLLSHFADYILENGADAYVQLSLNIKMALKIALIICYSRPFIENKDSYEIYKESIEGQLIKNFDDEEIIIHKNILEMRNQEVAHSDAPIQDVKSFESNIVHIAMSSDASIPLEFTIVESIKKMADKINVAADEIANHALENDVGITMQPTNEV